MRTVEFAYDIQAAVKVKPIGMVGVVDGLCLDIHGPMYRVVYWNEGLRQCVWMYAWEIEPAKNGPAVEPLHSSIEQPRQGEGFLWKRA